MSRAHDAQLIKKVETYLSEYDTDGLEIKILALLEAIVALPTDMFYNTGIATYVCGPANNVRPDEAAVLPSLSTPRSCRPAL